MHSRRLPSLMPSRRHVLAASISSLFTGIGGIVAIPARASDTTTEEIIARLRKSGGRKKRGASGPDTAVDPRLRRLIEVRRKRGGWNYLERSELYEATRDRPRIDLTVQFALASAKLRPEAEASLMQLGTALKHPDLKRATLVILGHTDASGSDEYNQILSEERAMAVKAFIVSRFQHDSELLLAGGYGKEQLRDPGNPFSEANRRVEIINAEV